MSKTSEDGGEIRGRFACANFYNFTALGEPLSEEGHGTFVNHYPHSIVF